jgi:hypothetical protein
MLKVFILFGDCYKIPTKDNMVTRGIIQHNANVCVSSCGNEETHLPFILGV